MTCQRDTVQLNEEQVHMALPSRSSGVADDQYVLLQFERLLFDAAEYL